MGRRSQNPTGWLRPRARSSAHRALAFETLEDRRLMTITVNTLVDENNGTANGVISLREAIAGAVAGETIDFSVTGTINLSGRGMTIRRDLTILGPGANQLTIDVSASDPTPNTNNGDRSLIFYIDDQEQFNSIDVEIRGLTLTGGDSSSGGGAVHSEESLTLADCVVTGNACVSFFPRYGGGIYARTGYYGTTTISNCVITNNVADDRGGGVYIRSKFSTSTISGCVISGNSAEYGGGVFINTTDEDSVTTIENCIISGNSAEESGGGVFSNSVGVGKVTIRDSTITDNSATYGGGIRSDASSSGSVTISQVTIVGNRAKSLAGGIWVLHSSSTVRTDLLHSTITNNVVDYDQNGFGSGGGLVVSNNSGKVYVEHTIVAENQDLTGARPDLSNEVALTSARFNLIGDNTGSGMSETLPGVADANGNLVGGPVHGALDPKLGALADNGGPTFLNGSALMTRLPMPGSPVIDAGDPAAVAGVGGKPEFDQRGDPFARVTDGNGSGGPRIDVGAIEVAASLRLGDYDQDGWVDHGDYQIWRGTFGSTADLQADGNGDLTVNAADFTVWRDNYGPQPNPLPGDYSFNSVVDAADYTVWRETLGSTSDLRADGSGAMEGVPDGVVDQLDYDFWKARFGNVFGAGSAALAEPVAPEASVLASQPPADPPERVPAGAVGRMTSREFSGAIRGDALIDWLASRTAERAVDDDAVDSPSLDESDAEGNDPTAAFDEFFHVLGQRGRFG